MVIDMVRQVRFTQGTIHILRKHIFRLFYPMCKQRCHSLSVQVMVGWSPSLLLQQYVRLMGEHIGMLNFENVHNFQNLYMKILNLKKGLFCLLTKRHTFSTENMSILHFVNKQKRPFLPFRTFSTFRKLLFSSEYFTINNKNRKICHYMSTQYIICRLIPLHTYQVNKSK